VPMALESRDLPESWEVTADSLAAWLARRLGARSVLLVKQIRPPGDLAPAAELVARGVVDPVLPRLLGAGGPEAYVVGPMDHAAAAAAIRERTVLGTRVAPG